MNLFKNLLKRKDKAKETEVKPPENLIVKDIQKNITTIKNDLGNSSDLIIKLSKATNNKAFQYASIYISELVNEKSIDNFSLILNKIYVESENPTSDGFYNLLMNNLTATKETVENTTYDMLYNYLLSGYSIFLVDGCAKFFSINTFDTEGRSVEEPTSQTIIRGPKESFTEKITVNIALVRKRIKNKALRVEDLNIGNISQTRVSLMYIDKIVKNEIVNEIKNRLSTIQIDAILDSFYIEELIKDDKYSIFPTFLNSEKPDSVAAALLEGRVAIFVDGTGFVITAPALFVEFFQVSEDYYHNFIISSTIRMIRLMAFILTLLVPAIYIALVTFHQEMIPTNLLISIAAQREGVPFPALAEALFMEATFEILREAGVRMPRAIGPAISIVGALVLGQAAVEAGLISAVIVIIVSITAISSFALPNYSMANTVRIIRFTLMILSGTFGIYGIFVGLIIMTLHLCKLKTIGIPYLTPITPKIKGGNKDTFFRFPLWKMATRPSYISADNSPRINDEDTVNTNEKH